jgi:hypothetical protein
MAHTHTHTHRVTQALQHALGTVQERRLVVVMLHTHTRVPSEAQSVQLRHGCACNKILVTHNYNCKREKERGSTARPHTHRASHNATLDSRTPTPPIHRNRQKQHKILSQLRTCSSSRYPCSAVLRSTSAGDSIVRGVATARAPLGAAKHPQPTASIITATSLSTFVDVHDGIRPL